MTKRHRKTPAAPKWKPKSLKEQRAQANAPAAGKPTTRVKFYDDQFNPAELALIAACVQDLSLDDEVWLQRVVNRRLLGLADQLEPAAQAEAAQAGSDAPAPQADSDPPAPEDTALKQLVHVAQALTTGAGRMARLLRDRRVLSGEAVDSLAHSVTTALEEFGQLIGESL
jgi:hypothetical protein